MEKYNFKETEAKWQKKWSESGIYNARFLKDKKKFYVLEMFPYTSAQIHMGHVRNYTIGDVIARFLILKGFNILHPIGYDAFGMPAENAAIKQKIHPGEWTYRNIATIGKQLKKLGNRQEQSHVRKGIRKRVGLSVLGFLVRTRCSEFMGTTLF